jgi:hypothetical protein
MEYPRAGALRVTFNSDDFMTIVSDACASAARTYGFRTWNARSGTLYANPFPEVFATAESVRMLKKQGFRVMPEVAVHEVLRKGGVGRGAPGKRGINGRFDVTAWNADGTPAAVLELKWKWNSVAADVARLVITRRKIEVRTFLGILAAEASQSKTEQLLKKRIDDLEKHGVRVARHATCRGVPCWEYVGGQPKGSPRAFAATVVEVVPC